MEQCETSGSRAELVRHLRDGARGVKRCHDAEGGGTVPEELAAQSVEDARVVKRSARATSTACSAADAREGLGGPMHEAGATAAVAPQATAVATAAVTAKCTVVPLLFDALTTTGPPDGRVAPSEGRVNASGKMPSSTSPHDWPQRPVRGRANFQGEIYLYSKVGGPPEEIARRWEVVLTPRPARQQLAAAATQLRLIGGKRCPQRVHAVVLKALATASAESRTP